jgi:hypothetical protein
LFILGFAHHNVTKTEPAPQSCHKPSNMEAKQQRAVKWNASHKAKFRTLILQRKIDPKRSDTDYIDKIRAKHFADRPVLTFRNNYKSSVSEYKIGQALNAANKARETRESRAAARKG